ncbi:hypothetical protein BATDEDRAFT_16815 [Batrachochytrium dendrobatidis JAM81]|uniref:Sugar phosphate transporter domain-containing protein n=3 Tax=Batrachochytrium dendrobatidis TaxID=109871 RepID=F4P4C7_BATDJ|nr:uncharacterized protein BATDEDRAFT_16815 [Batrachochytrium dendrobatidis JAM81]EGF79900.1 hypothetical protein BATDEDRAFT_16815 [Batrachochytrium dendrobatidis JAM81]OAJ38784.1 hypothetical protein BDEG_22690 [Batrachochytrium dendrobatidis JEL423]|eukprot:XP_006679382.1 hypothetical protein BATDEDRAFT_16815 [Batrachochytrium dendrobatidis JAM81]
MNQLRTFNDKRQFQPFDRINESQETLNQTQTAATRHLNWLKITKVAILIGSWFTVSISLHMLNKWMFSKEHFAFPFPVFTTMFQMIIQFGLSGLIMVTALPKLLPDKIPRAYDYLTIVLPCGIATALDIGLSNSSLKSITLSFYTMVKSASPVFVLLFAFIFGFEQPKFSMLVAILVIVMGVWIMVANETKFDAVGYTEAQIATIMSGLRWTLTQLLLRSTTFGKGNPLATAFLVSPAVAVSLFVAFLIMEGFSSLAGSFHFATPASIFQIVGLLFVNGMASFAVILLELNVIAETSVVTFSVAGIFKEIITIAVSAFAFGDRFTGNVLFGLAVSIAGIAGYNYIRFKEGQQCGSKKGHGPDTPDTDHTWQLLSSSDDMYDVELELELQLQLQAK